MRLGDWYRKNSKSTAAARGFVWDVENGLNDTGQIVHPKHFLKATVGLTPDDKTNKKETT